MQEITKQTKVSLSVIVILVGAAWTVFSWSSEWELKQEKAMHDMDLLITRQQEFLRNQEKINSSLQQQQMYMIPKVHDHPVPLIGISPLQPTVGSGSNE